MTSILNKLKQALTKTSDKISSGIDHIFYKKQLDDETLGKLEELLITADISYSVTSSIVDQIKSMKFDKEVNVRDVKDKLTAVITQMLSQMDHSFNLDEQKLNVILIVGVNGSGKTTTIGKLASNYAKQGKKVAIAACDTFRAAAEKQLATWAERAGSTLITGEGAADPASVAYTAMQESIKQGMDILFIDTAGRLHNQKNLMDELAKIVRVIRKVEPLAPHHSILVVDATIGQNVYKQVEQFKAVADIDGLVITKLDGSAKAGVIIGIIQQFLLPVHFIGIGENIEDLRAFEPSSFAHSLVGG